MAPLSFQRPICYLIALLLLAWSAGCTSKSGKPEPREVKWEPDPVPLLFTTDRNWRTNEDGGVTLGNERSDMRYGITAPVKDRVDSSVPLTELAKDAFLKKVVETAGESGHVIVYTHGYMVPFTRAGSTVARFQREWPGPGAVVLHSWPTNGGPQHYTHDTTNARWTQAHLRDLLQNLIEHPEITNVTLIGHSMGCQSAVGATIDLLRTHEDLRKEFNALVLLAPDLDADVFVRDDLPLLKKFGVFTTVYTSSSDFTLKTSAALHGYPRVGHAPLVVGDQTASSIDVIDVKEVAPKGFGHTYHRSSTAVIRDLYYLIYHRIPAAQRFGTRKVKTHNGEFWRIEQVKQ